MRAFSGVAIALAVCFLGTAQSADVNKPNPVTRVVNLMEDLAKKIVEDGKTEEGLWDSYVCWFKTLTAEKKASNSAAKDRLESLAAYIDDIESGRVEYSSERKDLEASIDKLNAEIETAADMRGKDHADFVAAEEEMTKAVDALQQALDELTAPGGQALLTTARSSSLRLAMSLGRRNLSEKDARLLDNVINNAKKEPSDSMVKVQSIVSEMKQTFEDNLAEARQKEDDDVQMHSVLSQSKVSQLSAAQDALAAGDGEGSLKFLNKEEAHEQVDALTEQIELDADYIAEAEASYRVKESEWKERKRLRTGEVAAISKAIETLRSDDNRDALSKSMKGAFFLQEGCSSQKRKKVVRKLLDTAVKNRDGRLTLLALQLRTGGPFDQIVSSIDKMVSDLHAEYEDDLRTKEDCEQQRGNNTRMAKRNAQTMDDMTALIARKQEEINEKTTTVEGIVEKVKGLELHIEEAQATRHKEALEFESSVADDNKAIEIIGSSKQVLADFYESEGLNLAQVGAYQARSDEPGTAPAPPPAIFSKPYGGAKGESAGIVSILEMLAHDLEKDIRVATDLEHKAISDYEEFHASTENLLDTLKAEKADLNSEIGHAEQAQVDARDERVQNKGVLDQTLAVLRSIAPGCDFIAANFALRKAQRESEADGLLDAKIALQGGTTNLLQKEKREEC